MTTIAPEIDPADIHDDEPLRNQVDLDSMDWLNFLLRINSRLHVSIPESDYGSLRTLTDVIDYIGAHSGHAAESPVPPASCGQPVKDEMP